MTDRFPICHPITAKWEGGWSDHPADPGGKTMYGVIQSVYDTYRAKKKLPKRSVHLITKDEALDIFRNNYWIPCGAPTLYPGVDLAVYDASVNSGVSRGVKWLKSSVGSNDHSETVRKICRARLSFVQSLKIWKTFGRGWARRIADIEVKGVVMALEAMKVSPKSIKAVAAAEAEKAESSEKANGKAANTSGVISGAGGSSVVVDPSSFDTSTIIAIGVLAVLFAVSAVVFFVRRRAAEARKHAYQGVAL